MTQAQGGNGQGATPQQLRAEVEEARGQLADTVSELAHKADMKSLARGKAKEFRSRAGNGNRRTSGRRSGHGTQADGTFDGESAPGSFLSERSAQDQRKAQLARVSVAVAGVLVMGGLAVLVLRRRQPDTGAVRSAGQPRHTHRSHGSRSERCGRGRSRA